MSDQPAHDQARFAAREFVARWARETGEQLSAVVTDRMLFAYEMGYLRGRGDSAHDTMRMFDSAHTREEARKRSDDDTE